MTQHPAVQRHFNTTTAQEQYAANFNAAFYPNIQIGPNYQGGAPAHFHAATYPTLNIQSGPNYQAEAPSNKHTYTPNTQLSFLVKFTQDQAETYFTRAKKYGSSVCTWPPIGAGCGTTSICRLPGNWELGCSPIPVSQTPAAPMYATHAATDVHAKHNCLGSSMWRNCNAR